MKKYSVHYTFIIILILAIMIGLIKETLLILFVLFLHEIGHLAFMKIFDYKINKVTFFPFGGVIIYENKNDFIYKTLLITFGGVCSNLMFFLLFKVLKLELLSDINLYFLFINLIPIYPLDGGRILILSLSMFLPYKSSKYIVHYFSLILSIVLLFFLISKSIGLYLYFFIAFFIRSNISSLICLKKDYQMFLLMKHLTPNKSLKHKETKIWCNNPIDNLFIGRYIIFNFDTFKVEEQMVLKNHFKNKKRL